MQRKPGRSRGGHHRSRISLTLNPGYGLLARHQTFQAFGKACERRERLEHPALGMRQFYPPSWPGMGPKDGIVSLAYLPATHVFGAASKT